MKACEQVLFSYPWKGKVEARGLSTFLENRLARLASDSDSLVVMIATFAICFIKLTECYCHFLNSSVRKRM